MGNESESTADPPRPQTDDGDHCIRKPCPKRTHTNPSIYFGMIIYEKAGGQLIPKIVKLFFRNVVNPIISEYAEGSSPVQSGKLTARKMNDEGAKEIGESECRAVMVRIGPEKEIPNAKACRLPKGLYGKKHVTQPQSFRS